MNILSNKRQPEEDYEAYQIRRDIQNKYIKMHLKRGIVFWPSRLKGTYRNDGRGLCNKP
jgi:hypothetical protein